MLKKILKIVGIILLLLVISAFAIPYFFKDQIKARILTSINEKVDAKVAFADADLSLVVVTKSRKGILFRYIYYSMDVSQTLFASFRNRLI